MAKPTLPIEREPPKRSITKQQALRHLIHAAVRMTAAREDPFAIHLVIQSADKLLIDLSSKMGKPLVLRWDEFMKPEYKSALLSIHRETFNFLKHADKDYDQELYVGEIAHSNFLQLGVCIAKYHAMFGVWTEHMQLFFKLLTMLVPGAFSGPSMEAQMSQLIPKIEKMTIGQFFTTDLWSDEFAAIIGSKLNAERAEDLQDTNAYYDSTIAAVMAKASK